MTVDIWSTAATAIRTAPSHADTHHIFVCGSFGGNGEGGMRPKIVQGLVDSGCQVFSLSWDEKHQSDSLANVRAIYDVAQQPYVFWYSVTAHADSSVSTCFPDQSEGGA
jgi:hypothetical protein